MKIRPVGAELFHADGQTGMAKLTVAFHNAANALKNNNFIGGKKNIEHKMCVFTSCTNFV